MSRRADRFLSWLLIILSAAIFAGIVLLGVPRLLAPQQSTEVAASSISTPIPVSAEPTPIPATLVPTDLPEIIPTEPLQEPTSEPTAVQSTLEPTEIPVPTEVLPTATAAVLEGIVLASDDVIMFRSASADMQTGTLFRAGEMADAVGRSADSLWVYIITISDQGWIPAVEASFEAGNLDTLPEVDIVLAEPIVTPTNTVVVVILPTATPVEVAQVQPTVAATLSPVTPTAWPTQTPDTFAFPTPVPTVAVQQPPPTQPSTTTEQNSADATDQNMEPTGNAIAWWDVSPATARVSGSGTWLVDIVVRVPTSFQYTFDMALLWRVSLRDRNLDGDDYYILELSGMPCGSPVSAPLVVRQAGVRMKVVNEFSVQEGPIFVSPAC